MKLFNKIREQQLKKRRLFYEETLDMQFSLKLHNGKMYILRDNKPVILLSSSDTVVSIVEKIEALKTLDRVYHNVDDTPEVKSWVAKHRVMDDLVPNLNSCML